MSLISDELLMAYADGELEGDECANLESGLLQSSELAARLAVFSATGRGLAQIFDKPMQEPVPQRLVDAIYAAPAAGVLAGGRKANENVVPFASRKPQARSSQRSVLPQQLALAAACVTLLAVGAGTYWHFNNPAGQAGESFALAQSKTGERIASAELASALDSVLGDQTAVMQISGTPATIKPLFTFATADKSFCRQYEITRASAQAIAGVACRGSEGQWRVETHVAFEKVAPAASDIKTADIKTAGKASIESVEAAVNRLISGDVLGNDQEAALMKQGWKAAP